MRGIYFIDPEDKEFKETIKNARKKLETSVAPAMPQKGKWPPRGTGTTVLTFPCPSQPCFGGSKVCARVTGKAGENGQHSGEMGGSSPWTRPSAPGCGDTLKALADDQRPTAPGRYPGSPAGRTPPHGDGSMYGQANVRAGKVLRLRIRALPSVIVDTEKVLREADGSVELVVVRPHADGKVFAPGCASKAGRAPVRSPKNTSG